MTAVFDYDTFPINLLIQQVELIVLLAAWDTWQAHRLSAKLQ
jgi:hypothetical protein